MLTMTESIEQKLDSTAGASTHRFSILIAFIKDAPTYGGCSIGPIVVIDCNPDT